MQRIVQKVDGRVVQSVFSERHSESVRRLQTVDLRDEVWSSREWSDQQRDREGFSESERDH